MQNCNACRHSDHPEKEAEAEPKASSAPPSPQAAEPADSLWPAALDGPGRIVAKPPEHRHVFELADGAATVVTEKPLTAAGCRELEAYLEVLGSVLQKREAAPPNRRLAIRKEDANCWRDMTCLLVAGHDGPCGSNP